MRSRYRSSLREEPRSATALRSSRRVALERRATSSGESVSVRRSGRTPAAKQNLVGVDAPHARDDALVGEGGLQRHATGAQTLPQDPGGEPVHERVGPEAGEVDGQPVRPHVAGDVPLPEGARVDEVQLAPVVELRHDVGVGQGRGRPGGRGVDPEELARHAQMDDEDLAVVELEGEELAFPPDRLDPAAPDALGELGGVLPPHRSPAGDADLHETAADEALLEATPDGLDLRELRQARSDRLRAARPAIVLAAP